MRTSKLAQLLNSRLRVTLLDGRVMIGQLLAHDKHLNLVLADCEEFRLAKKKSTNSNVNNNSVTRTLGLIVLRGEEIVSISQESGAPPRGGNKARIPASRQASNPQANAPGAPGTSHIPPPGAPPVGLAGPVPGMFIRPGF